METRLSKRLKELSIDEKCELYNKAETQYKNDSRSARQRDSVTVIVTKLLFG